MMLAILRIPDCSGTPGRDAADYYFSFGNCVSLDDFGKHNFEGMDGFICHVSGFARFGSNCDGNDLSFGQMLRQCSLLEIVHTTAIHW